MIQNIKLHAKHCLLCTADKQKKYIIYVTLRACYINKILYGIDQKFQQLNSHKEIS